MTDLERIPADEATAIAAIADLTIKQLERRYGTGEARRGVHAKAHGCVSATFTVNGDLPEALRVGVFAVPGTVYDAVIRFSNASVNPVEADSSLDPKGLAVHGSRGMAIKLYGVSGTPLAGARDPVTQDFVMVNQPVFAFANVEDYLALSEVLLRDKDDPTAFFARARATEGGAPTAAARRAARTLQIVQRVRSRAVTADPAAYQAPPPSPLDNRYFSAAPFLFGDDRVMKFSATPVTPDTAEDIDVADGQYLRTALRRRLSTPGASTVAFTFQVQVRTAADLAGHIETDIEDVSVEWDPQTYPFTDVATIAIPPQVFETDEQTAACEALTFSPWHGLEAHRPLGGINRLRRAVYEASSGHRLQRLGGGGSVR